MREALLCAHSCRYFAHEISIMALMHKNFNGEEKFCNCSKLCVISFFVKKVHFLPRKHAPRCFLKEFSHNYWQESFDGDSFVSQSRLDANVLLNIAR